MSVSISDSGIVFNDGSLQPTALTTGTQTIAGAKTFSSNTTFSAGVQGALVLATAQSATGTAVDFTGIPSWVRRVTVIGTDVSSNGTSSLLLRIGDGAISATGYIGGNFGNTNQANTSTIGVVLLQATNAAVNSYAFAITFTLQTANKWVAAGTVTRDDGVVFFVSSYKSLSGTLDRLRLTTVNGTDTFDAGSVNIMYEG